MMNNKLKENNHRICYTHIVSKNDAKNTYFSADITPPVLFFFKYFESIFHTYTCILTQDDDDHQTNFPLIFLTNQCLSGFRRDLTFGSFLTFFFVHQITFLKI